MLSVWQLLGFVGVLILIMGVVVGPFLLYLYHRDKQAAASEAARLQSMRDVGSACHAFQRDMNSKNVEAFNALAKVIEKSTDALIRNSEMLRRLEEVVAKQAKDLGPGGVVRT